MPYVSFFIFFFPFSFAGLYDVPVGIIILLSLFYGSISVIAVVGNTLVIWIVATTKQMQTVTNLFIANLALADVVIGMFAIPFQVKHIIFPLFMYIFIFILFGVYAFEIVVLFDDVVSSYLGRTFETMIVIILTFARACSFHLCHLPQAQYPHFPDE